jgi:peptidoglycan/LPS O-acetylase OafA/YrhL
MLKSIFLLLSNIFLQVDLYEYQQNKQKNAYEFLFGMFIFYFVTLFILIFFYIIPLWKIFHKAGKPGWTAIIPVYNIIVLLEIVGRPLWWIVWLLIPLVNIVFLFILCIDLAKSFNKNTGYGISLALLSVIFLPILGYGKAQYAGKSVVSLNQP